MKRHTRSGSVGKVSPIDLEKSTPKVDKLGSPEKRRKKHTNFLKEYLIDYTANSNLHGLKYIGEKERTSVEKVFWLFMFTCCVVLCAGLIRKVYIKWNESPVIVSFAENPTPVWQIPYPAVTVCFETKAMQTRFNFTNYFHLYNNETTKANLTEEEKLQNNGIIRTDWGDLCPVAGQYRRNMFEDVSLVCDDHLAPKTGRKTSPGYETVNQLRELSPNITDFFFGCKWQDIPKESCTDLFSSIVTEEGICYTFNTLSSEDLFRVENLHEEYQYLEALNTSKVNHTWSLDDGYPPDTPLETYPHRGLGYGAKAGLTFLLKTKEIDLDYLCKGPVQSFKILLHNPAELPRLTQQYFRSPLSQEVVVAVKPKMMMTSSGLKPYNPSVRQCYFPSERYLQYFKVYTQANCEMECLTNFTNARCGCVHFGMPHGPNMKVCNAGSIDCIKKARTELVTAAVRSNLEEESSTNETSGEAWKIAEKCQCMPSCTSIEYEAETSQADYDWKALFRAYRLPIDENQNDLLFARVMIFFKEAQFITSRRSELYGQTDFLANCGGLLGLFMGFSVLSVTEIVYFLTLRLCCLLRRKRQAKKQQLRDSPGKVKQTYVD